MKLKFRLLYRKLGRDFGDYDFVYKCMSLWIILEYVSKKLAIDAKSI